MMMMTRCIFIKINRNIVAAISAFLLLVIFAGGQTTAQGPTDPRFDLTDNGIIDDADALMVLNALNALQEEGLCISSQLADHDINTDGCIDIFDAQIILAHWGERTRPEPPQPLIAPAASATFTVNSADDDQDSNKGNGVCDTGSTVTVSGNTSPECTLRAAIQESNARSGPETINFNVRNSDGSCPGLVTINTTSNNSLLIDDPNNDGVTIDGYSQCQANPNTVSPPNTGNADINIQIRGPQTLGSKGLYILSANNTIKGLAIYRSRANILLEGLGATNNTIQGNFIGSSANLSWGSYGNGINLWSGAKLNLVGGYRPQERNIFIGTKGEAVNIDGTASRFNVIIGNYIGVKQDGKTTGPGGRSDGMDIDAGVVGTWIGASPPGWINYNQASSAIGWPPAGAPWPPDGWLPGDDLPAPDRNRVYDNRERNIISGNLKDGIEISHKPGPNHTYVLNNYIGVDVKGTTAVGNGYYGITIEDTPHQNFIYDNVIVNNGYSGMHLWGLSSDNQIVDNYIGLAPNGVTPMGNGVDSEAFNKEGITLLAGSKNNLILNNTIANNPDEGVRVSTKLDDPTRHTHETFYNTITQNSMYNNGKRGIKLHSGTDTSLIGNQGLPSPQISNATLTAVTGTAKDITNSSPCANCIIELFIAQVNDSEDLNNGGEGKTFIKQVTANGSGVFAFSLVAGDVNLGDLVTTTATDASGNTSEFSPNREVTLGNTPTGFVRLNGGTGLQTVYNDVLAQFSAQDNNQVKYWRYRVDNPSLPSWTEILSPGPTFADEDVLTLSDGFHTIYAQYQDNEGNVSSVYNATITIVNVGNPGNPPNGAITINNGDLYTNDPNLSLQLIGPPPPFYTKDMMIGENSNLNGSDWEPYLVQTVWALDNPPTNQSVMVDMYARYRDTDNTETSIVTDDILFDPVSPTLTISFDVDTKELDLSGTQDDNNGSGLAEMRFYDQAFPNHDTGWMDYETTYTWPWLGGAQIIVEVRDNAGNVTIASSPQVIPGPSLEAIYLPIIVRGF